MPTLLEAFRALLFLRSARVDDFRVVSDGREANTVVTRTYAPGSAPRFEVGTLDADVKKGEFDWAHYQVVTGGGQGMFGNEFNITPTVMTLEQLYATESMVNMGVNAIMRQMHAGSLFVKRLTSSSGESTKSYNHPLARLFQNPVTESGSDFLGNFIGNALPVTGNAFAHIQNFPDGRRLRRLPTSRMQIRYGADGSRIGYELRAGGSPEDGFSRKPLSLSNEEVIHVRLANPYSIHVGLSLLIAASQPVLTDKYMYEYLLGFFLRGGSTAGVIETESNDVKQITRLIKSIQQLIGTRRNMHSDKILPKGATFKAGSKSLGDMQFLDILKTNARRIMGHLKVPPFELGDTDSVNRANADAQRRLFWETTIIPLQMSFCDGVKASPLWKLYGLGPDDQLSFDNSHVPWLDPFKDLLDEDPKLAKVCTVNERRERLGFKPIERFGDKLEAELVPAPAPGVMALAAPLAQLPGGRGDVIEANSEDVTEDPTLALDERRASFKAEAEVLNDEPSKIVRLFEAEIREWAGIVADVPGSKELALAKIHERAKEFAAAYVELALPRFMRAYDMQLRAVKEAKSFRWAAGCSKHAPVFISKESEKDRKAKLAALRERAETFLAGKIREDEESRFLGYSQTATERAYALIEQELAEGGSMDSAASKIRRTFGEAYAGQALTIVRTEYLHGISLATDKFTRDLATVAARTKKTWIHSGSGGQPRPEHEALDGVELEGKSDEVADMVFAANLRYPRDTRGEAEDVISCRCILINEVSEWGDEE